MSDFVANFAIAVAAVCGLYVLGAVIVEVERARRATRRKR